MEICSKHGKPFIEAKATLSGTGIVSVSFACRECKIVQAQLEYSSVLAAKSLRRILGRMDESIARSGAMNGSALNAVDVKKEAIR